MPILVYDVIEMSILGSKDPEIRGRAYFDEEMKLQTLLFSNYTV